MLHRPTHVHMHKRAHTRALEHGQVAHPRGEVSVLLNCASVKGSGSSWNTYWRLLQEHPRNMEDEYLYILWLFSHSCLKLNLAVFVWDPLGHFLAVVWLHVTIDHRLIVSFLKSRMYNYKPLCVNIFTPLFWIVTSTPKNNEWTTLNLFYIWQMLAFNRWIFHLYFTPAPVSNCYDNFLLNFKFANWNSCQVLESKGSRMMQPRVKVIWVSEQEQQKWH